MAASSWSPLLTFILLRLLIFVRGQMPPVGGVQVKITSEPFQVATSQHLSQITWNKLGQRAQEKIYCVSESPVSQLRFVCVDCAQKNISDMYHVLNSAEDQTRTAGFPTVALLNVDAQPNWTGATIICQAALNGGTVDSPPSVVDVRYLQRVAVVDSNGQSPVQTEQGNFFYVECVRGNDGSCQQQGRRRTLHCSTAANPPPSTYRWLKNGQILSGNGPEITIGSEMIGLAIQCMANNGLYPEGNWPTASAVYIQSYSAARLTADNFAQPQSGLQQGNRVDIGGRISLSCNVEGNPRPVVFWRLKRHNGQVVDAACPQGSYGQYREQQQQPFNQLAQPGLIRLTAICDLQISNYSFSGSYWCSACSYVSQGNPECSPPLDAPGERFLGLQVQGAPMLAETEPTVEHNESQNSATIYVPYCADPVPRPPRELVFSIDSNDIPPGQRWENFYFEGTTQNNTLPNCFHARLRISPVHDYDYEKQVSLKLQNQFGTKQITVPLSDLLGYTNSRIGGMPTWLIIFFAMVSSGLFIAVGVLLCSRWKLLCFEGDRGQGSQYSNDKLKGTHEAYIDDGLFTTGAAGSPEVISLPPPKIGHGGLATTAPLPPPPDSIYVSREAVV